MSIESNLKTLAENSTRIADALEQLCVRLSPANATASAADTVVEAPVPTPPPAAPATEAPVPTPPVAPAPTEAPVPTPPVAPATEVPAPPVAEGAMTAEQLNTVLVAEFKRLGSREGIDAIMKDMGVNSINDLKVEQYNDLITRVKAL